MRTKNLPHLLTVLLLVLTLAGATSCNALAGIGTPQTFDPAGPRNLVLDVAARTNAYVSADESLIGVEKSERAKALFVLESTFTIEPGPLSFAEFQRLSEDPFAWHDAYVRGDPELAVYQRDAWLMSTELLRARYWPEEP